MHAIYMLENPINSLLKLLTQINQLMNQAINAAKEYFNVKIETGSQHTPIHL